ncbi:unnamed protein product [Ascophyllum nodosum]
MSPSSRSSRSRPDHARRVGGGLVFIKSFKTGSTTLATYIAQIGHQNRAYFLHPRATGWFAQGELESRRDQGQTFDISLRHVTPYTPYNVLEALVPGAVFATIMRDPVERFLSLFNFRGEIKRKFRHPQALVAAIRAGELPLSDSRPFCNQLAWLMSGEDIDYTRIDDDQEASRVAEAVIDEVDRRNLTVLLTERMSESVAVLAHRMGWRMDELTLRVSSQRVQRNGRDSRFFSCDDYKDHACVSAIRRCNLVDGLLYEHYEKRFDDLVQRLPSTDHASQMLDEMSPAKSSMSRLELGSFPVNCIEKAPSEDDIYSRLHSCGGRPVIGHAHHAIPMIDHDHVSGRRACVSKEPGSTKVEKTKDCRDSSRHPVLRVFDSCIDCAGCGRAVVCERVSKLSLAALK